MRGIDNYQTVISVILPRSMPTTARSFRDDQVSRYEQEDFGGELIELFPSQDPMRWAISLGASEPDPLPEHLPTTGQDLNPRIVYAIARMIPNIPATSGRNAAPTYRIL